MDLKNKFDLSAHEVNKYLLVLALVLVSLLARLIDHIPNFTPILPIALFLGTYANKVEKKFIFIVPLSIMLVSDALIGFHSTALFVYLSIFLIFFIGTANKNKSYKTTAINVITSSVLFFLITNFGVWFMENMYTKDLTGLLNCYLMAIPFMKTELVANILFSGALFGGKYLLDKHSNNLAINNL